MHTIYEPKGKAREYAPLAVNLYRGCPHRCKYCYSPKVLRMKAEEFHAGAVPRKDILHRLNKDCAIHAAENDTRPVLMCFSCDPYPPLEEWQRKKWLTREALKLMQQFMVKPIILTKGGTRACRDFDILADAGGWFGQTVSTFSDAARQEWEPHAAPAIDRTMAYGTAARLGVKRWVSVEPVLSRSDALQIVQAYSGLPMVEHFKLGKLNGYDAETRAIEKGIDWAAYREEAREILVGNSYREIDEAGAFEVGTFYVKSELKEAK